ncbi:phosphopantetheine-binding protein, partial [Frankia sp. AgKG'84/4]|uniref:phosphopantetheine-binding protein n=1 Tax=Frankia sp. AgKG'84/4 TaxID=573490 RepID=UPI00202A71B5
MRRCAEEGLDVRPLPVSAAFHTRYVAHAVDRFAEALASTPVHEPTSPVYPNTTGASYGADPAANAAVLARQLLEPVEFVGAVRAAHEAGATVFVEFGPKQVLTRLVRQILPDADVIAIPTDAGPLGDSDVTLKAAAVQLAVLGVPLTGINRFQAEPLATVPSKGPTVTLSAPEYTPPARRDAHAATLADDYQILGAAVPAQAAVAAVPAPFAVAATPGATANGATAPPGVPGEGAVNGASAHSVAPNGAVINLAATHGVATNGAATNGAATNGAATNGAATNGAATNGVPVTGPSTNGATSVGAVPHGAAALGTTSAGPVPNGSGTGGAVGQHLAQAGQSSAFGLGFDAAADVLAQQVNLHGVYLTGQLDVASRLVDALHEYQRGGREDARFADAIAMVANQSAVIGQTHTQANEVLAHLAALELAVDPTGLAGARASVPSVPTLALSSGPAAPRSLTASVAAPPAPPAAAPVAAPPAPAPVAPPVPVAPVVPVVPLVPRQPAGPVPARVTAPAAAPAKPATAGLDRGAVRAALVEVVAEKTGYAPDMIDTGMDLEADLGVDSIKRVQVLGALRERFPQAPTVGPEQLAELRTLDQITEYVTAALPAAPLAAPATAAGQAAGGLDRGAVRAALVEVVAEKTGYAPDM